ncbi:MFS transporter [Actinophytocola sp. NPDC049390]|uniref:MFS transporter n=1 Tax=Actinophytocola sp. NPDC049390 TaxID=3363894 RepID=UPI0037930A60
MPRELLGGEMAGRNVPFFAALTVDALGTGTFVPLSLLYVARVPRIDLATVGVLLSVAAAASLPMPVVTGHLVDRFGPKPVVVAAHLLQAAGFAAYLAVTGPVTSLVAATATAAGQRVFWSSVFSLVAELAERDGDGKAPERWFALVGMAQTAGLGVGGLASGLLLGIGTPTVFRLAVAANAVTFLLAALLVLLVRVTHDRPAARADGGYRVLLADRPYLGLIATNTVFALCGMFLGLALPVYVAEGLPAPDWVVGPLLAGNTILLAVGQTTAVRMVRALTRTRVMALSGVLWAVWGVACALALVVPAAVLVPYLAVTTLCFTAAAAVRRVVGAGPGGCGSDAAAGTTSFRRAR